MHTFEPGKTYETRSICDSNNIIRLTVASRTAKSIKTSDGKTLRIKVIGDTETVKPFSNYSMAPMIRAERVVAEKAGTFQVGQEVIATRMAPDSFYRQVRGTVTAIRNGFVCINATQVISKWGKTWEKHPTSCATSAKIEHVIAAPAATTMKLLNASEELIAEMDEALLLDAASNRVFEIRDMDTGSRQRVNIADLLRDNETDPELCNWIRAANLRAEFGSAQGKIILRRVE